MNIDNLNNVLKFYSSSNGSSWDLFNTPVNTVATITPNTWHHIAVSRTTTTMYVYYDGTVSLTRDLTGIGFTGAVDHTIFMGASDYLSWGNDSWTGYIADFRFVYGETPYTGTNFTPPSIPLEATQEKSGQIGPIVFTTSTRFLVGGTLPTPPFWPGIPTITDRSYYQNPEVYRWGGSGSIGQTGDAVAGILGGTTPGFPTLTPNYTTLLTLQSPIAGMYVLKYLMTYHLFS